MLVDLLIFDLKTSFDYLTIIVFECKYVNAIKQVNYKVILYFYFCYLVFS